MSGLTLCFSGSLGDQRPEVPQAHGTSRPRSLWCPSAPRLQDARRAEGGEDYRGAEGGGEGAQAQEDRLCGYRQGEPPDTKPQPYVGLVVRPVARILAAFSSRSTLISITHLKAHNI